MPPNAITHLDEEWWTTEMVCAFLKIGRKALWERRRNQTLAVPRAYRMAGKRNLYRAQEIKDWATWIAERPLRVAELRGETPRTVTPVAQLISDQSPSHAGDTDSNLQMQKTNARRSGRDIDKAPLAPTITVTGKAAQPVAAVSATKETEAKARRRRAAKYDPAQLSLF